jgi:glycosyltransferase involved in cell wall biosynthesis
MKILFVHNAYQKVSGEEIMISRIIDVLKKRNHEVSTYFRNSNQITSTADKTRAFFSEIYSRKSRTDFRTFIARNRPDIIQIQNLYPQISPSILLEARQQKIPVVMRCSNYRLICPNGLLMTRGKICERCTGGHEWWCLLRNCEESLPKSLGYALRNYIARVGRLYLDNVTAYYAQTDFQRRTLAENGLPLERIFLIPNMIEPRSTSAATGRYVAFSGRISPEKGVSSLIAAAKLLPQVAFKAAGDYGSFPQLPRSAPSNLTFCGNLSRARMPDFYKSSRFSVVCSIWYEGFPSTILEPMMMGKPVICANIGGLSEIVEDGVTGLLFKPGDARDLSRKIELLWNNPSLCRQLGQTGRAKALDEYSAEKYYARLMEVYEQVLLKGGAA